MYFSEKYNLPGRQAEKLFPFSVPPSNSKKFLIFCFKAVAADGPVPDALALWHALCAGTGRHLLGLPGFWQRQTVSPKSWILSRKLRISYCSPESQKKEKVSPPGCYWMNLMYLSGRRFSDAGRNLTGCTCLTATASSQPQVYSTAARRNKFLRLVSG